jgi:hypothetical protein
VGDLRLPSPNNDLLFPRLCSGCVQVLTYQAEGVECLRRAFEWLVHQTNHGKVIFQSRPIE